jgi:hypothetical protein
MLWKSLTIEFISYAIIITINYYIIVKSIQSCDNLKFILITKMQIIFFYKILLYHIFLNKFKNFKITLKLILYFVTFVLHMLKFIKNDHFLVFYTYKNSYCRAKRNFLAFFFIAIWALGNPYLSIKSTRKLKSPGGNENRCSNLNSKLSSLHLFTFIAYILSYFSVNFVTSKKSFDA